MLYIRKATLCMKNKEQTQEIQEEENREEKKKLIDLLFYWTKLSNLIFLC